MAAFVTDKFATPLAKRLASLDIEDLIEAAYDFTLDESRDLLRGELRAEGASPEVVKAVEPLWETRYMHASLGVPEDSPAAQEAEDFEYGSHDRSVMPHGVFRGMSQDMAAIAIAELARLIGASLRG